MARIYRFLLQHRTWLVLGLVMLFVCTVRIRLLNMPLERDEGEYAYSGQLILQGIPPYKLAYNMKFPGIYGAYALILLLFGQTAAAIHFGLLVVNLASILLLFLLARKLLDLNGALVATTTFALLSLSLSVLGLAAHASHFVVLFALGGTLLLLKAVERPRPAICFLSGTLFGFGFLMKQPGIFWGIFGLFYLGWALVKPPDPSGSEAGSLHRSRRGHQRKSLKPALVPCLWYCLGLGLPFLLMCLALAAAGVFDRFIFWTFTYAREYVSVHPLFTIPSEQFRSTLGAFFGPNVLFWAIAILGAVLMWWEERLRQWRVFLAGFIGVSLVAVCPGWYFRQHYFVFVLPATALLVAIAINRALHLLKHDRTIELFMAIPILGLFPLALLIALMGNGGVWFALSPAAASNESYLHQMFPEAAQLGEYIRAHASPGARVAVVGSEPEIYFYSRRHSATGFIYVYPLMEHQKYASQMQDQMIQEIEAAKPEYLIFVQVQESWLLQPDSERKVGDWYESYSKANYELVQLRRESIENAPGDAPADSSRPPGVLLLFQRKN